MRAPFRVAPEAVRGVRVEGDSVRWSYRVRVSTDAPAHDWELFLDATTGAELARRDRLHHVSGSGQAFDPNPVATTGDTTLRDNNDADSTELDGALFPVILERLHGSGYLRGPFVDARSKNASQRASSASLVFDYTRDQSPAFEQVSVRM